MDNSKIIKLNPQPAKKDVLSFQKTLDNLQNTYDLIDRAGMAIGEDHLAIRVVTDIQILLMLSCRPEYRQTLSTDPVNYSQRNDSVSKLKIKSKSKKTNRGVQNG